VIRLFHILVRLRLAGLATWAAGLVPLKELRKLATVFRNWSNDIPPYPERKLDGQRSYDLRRELSVFESAVSEIWEHFRTETDSEDWGLFFTYFSMRKCPELFFHGPVELYSSLGMSPVSPFWDDEIVALSLSIPTSMKIRRNRSKYVLRKAAALGSEDEGYWMLPKVGLQSSFQFLIGSRRGREWERMKREEILDSAELAYLREAIPGTGVTPQRLLPYFAWLDVNSDRVAF